MNKRTQKKINALRTQYAKVNALWNLGNHREQVLRLSFVKLTAQGKRIPDAKMIRATKLRAQLESWAREREKLLTKIQSLMEA